MAVAADVPAKYDVIINGQGYVFLNTVDPSLPFRVQRGIYSYSRTFSDRQNTTGQYGDNNQDFFLTLSQNDWSLGGAQRYYRSTDPDRVRRFWTDANIDPITIPGQISLRQTTPTATTNESVIAMQSINTGTQGVYVAGTTGLSIVDSTGTVTTKGAHGLGAAPSFWGITTDSNNVYLSTTSGGSVGVRKYTGSAFSTFSASGADSLSYLNNTLYGYKESTGELVKWDTGGNISTLFTWKDASGTALSGSTFASRLRAYGGKLVILRKVGVRGQGELYQYDGTGVSQTAEFPANFVVKEMEVVAGIVFVSGYFARNSDNLPAILYYVNSTVGLLWRANVPGYTNPTWPSMAAYGEGLAFTDDTTGKIMQYNIAVGGVHAMGAYTVTNANPLMAAAKDFILHSRASTTLYYFPSTTISTSGTIDTSLFDFENSLNKQFRGIKVDFNAATTGNGGSVDIAYQIDSVDGAYTSLQTGAVTGTEYTLTGVSGHAISVRITLNKGTSTLGPLLKRIYVRAAPQLQTFRRDEFIIDMTGKGGKNPVKLRDQTDSPLDGLEMAINMRTAIASTSPISVTDRFGTYTAMFEPDQSDIFEVRPEEFVARVRFREV